MKANPPQSRESRPSGCTADLATCPGRRLTCTKALPLPSMGSLLAESPGLVSRLRPPPGAGQEAAE